jgi:hypothetical protein
MGLNGYGYSFSDLVVSSLTALETRKSTISISVGSFCWKCVMC